VSNLVLTDTLHLLQLVFLLAHLVRQFLNIPQHLAALLVLVGKEAHLVAPDLQLVVKLLDLAPPFGHRLGARAIGQALVLEEFLLMLGDLGAHALQLGDLLV